jgi:hypothetical protein
MAHNHHPKGRNENIIMEMILVIISAEVNTLEKQSSRTFRVFLIAK